MIKFFYQVLVTNIAPKVDLYVDGTVTGNTVEECIAFVHKNGKAEMSKALRAKDSKQYIDSGNIQSRMTMFVQMFEPSISMVTQQLKKVSPPCA